MTRPGANLFPTCTVPRAEVTGCPDNYLLDLLFRVASGRFARGTAPE